MHAAAVCRLDEDVVRLLDDRWVAQDRGVRAAQVAGEYQGPGRRVSLRFDAQLHDRGAQDVARVVEDGGDSRRDGDRRFVAHSLEPCQRRLGLRDVVERPFEHQVRLRGVARD